MDNVILWIKSNKDVVDAYKRTKVDCNYHNKSDNDFLMFLLEAATNVLSIVHQFSPQITGRSEENSENDTGSTETIVTKDDEINLEKLDKQLRISIVCPDLENSTSAKQQNLSDQETSLTDSTSALKDISDHVNELESVLESLNKSCPSPLSTKTIFRPLSSRTFLESLKPPICAAKLSETNNFLSAHDNSALYPKPVEPSFVKPSESSFIKFKGPALPLMNKRNLNSSMRTNVSVRSSPNVTISAESQLNLAQNKERALQLEMRDKASTIIKPIPMMMRSPEKERTPSPPLETDPQIDVVNPDQETPRRCPTPEPEFSTKPVSQPVTPSSEQVQQFGGVKRKVECLSPEDNGTPEDHFRDSVKEHFRDSVKEHDQRSRSPADAIEQQQPDLTNLPTDSELTQQLMSVIQSTIAQTSSITCQECGLIFANEVNLHRHMLTHLDSDNKEQYNCPTCAFKTPRRQTLAKHITTVHSRDRSSGILYCDQCEYKTPTKSHLRNHMLAHTGNRQYQCPHCTYNSNFSNALTRHMTMHSREMFESKINSSRSS